MALVQSVIDRWRALAVDRVPWEKMWLDVARYTLPNAERFDKMFSVSPYAAINSVASEPVAANRSREIYDTTSIWAVNRGAAGTLSLVTPQTGTWHDLGPADPFAGDPEGDEAEWFERLRDYLFATRSNPRSGFWPNHKASLRCMWAMGTAVTFIGDGQRNAAAPISYAFVPISENYLATNFEGVHDTNYRCYTRSARQCVERWGTRCSAKTQAQANDPKDRDKPVTIIHAVQPRAEKGSYGNTLRNAPFMSCIVEMEEKHLIEESGFWEFPFRVDCWERAGTQPYSEGAVSLCLAEIKSLNMLAKSELTGAAQSVNPPLAVAATEGLQRFNLNPSAINPGYVTPQGQLLAQPVLTARPDFARAVIEARQAGVRTGLYVDMWTAIIESPREMTAYETMVRAQEKADILGPIGTSLQMGIYFQVEREVAMLGRMGAFAPGSPLEAPESLRGQDIAARFTSPLDRLRRMGEVEGLQRTWAFAGQVSEVDPSVIDKLDADESIDFAAKILGAPAKVMRSDDEVAAIRAARAEQQSRQQAVQDAANAGIAGQEAAAGAEAIAASPAAQAILTQIGGAAAA